MSDYTEYIGGGGVGILIISLIVKQIFGNYQKRTEKLHLNDIHDALSDQETKHNKEICELKNEHTNFRLKNLENGS